MSKRLALTGANGTVGLSLIQELQRLNLPFRALTRHPESLSHVQDVCFFDYQKKETFAKAIEGCDQLVLVAPVADSHLEAFLQTLKGRISQVVIISGISANTRKDSQLARIESMVYKEEIPYTTLRCNWFMQNFITFWRDMIVQEKKIALPTGDGKSSVIDVRDIARCIVKTLTDTQHLGKIYTLTGPEALSYDEMAKLIGVKYKAISDEGKSGEEKLLFQEIRQGLTAGVSPDVKKITGLNPNTFVSFVQEFRKVWQ